MGCEYEAPPNSGGDQKFEEAEVGNQHGRCIQVIDLGQIENTHPQAKNQYKREIMLVFELAQTMQDGRPFVVNRVFTMSLADTAHLTSHLEKWRGEPFTDEQKKKFNFASLLGCPALLSIVRAPDKKVADKFWTNIDSITPAMKGMEVPKQVNESVDFGIGDIGGDEWNKLYPWVQTRIIKKYKEGKEYLAANPDFVYGQKPASDTPPAESAGGAANSSEPPFTPEDDIPF
jgi:hypothetical protein